MTGQLELPDGSTHAVFDGMTIGRVAACDVTIDDDKASRQHARLIVAGGVVEVEDLGSRNGILLNGVKVTRRMLRDGDAVQIGTTILTYREPAAARPAPAADDLAGLDLLEPGPVLREPAAGSEAPTAPRRPLTQSPAPPSDGDGVLEFEDLTADADDDEDEEEEEIVVAPRAAPRPVAPPPPPPPPRAETVDVLEFEDEIVEVRKPAAPSRAPGVTGAPRAAAPVRDGGVLQYNKKKRGGGLFGEDLGQMGGPMKAVLVLVALAIAGGLGWLAFSLVS